jgi:hypothetical protein
MMRAQVEHSGLRKAAARRGRGLRTGLALTGLLLASACGPDPESKFDEFVKQTKEDTAGMGSTSAPGTTTEEPTGGTGSTSGGPVAYDINGDFLLAVSTTVDRGMPLQFIATNTVTDMGGKLVLDSCLQPLSLTQGKVTVPREPIGDPLCFTGIEVIDGAFTIDAGVVMVTGMANPITGGDIVASLVMMGSAQSDDLYCGTVSGMVMQPLETSIDGSSFAAVRLTDTTVLPNPIVIDCKGTTVTDK